MAIFTNDPAHRVLNARISGNVEPLGQVEIGIDSPIGALIRVHVLGQIQN